MPFHLFFDPQKICQSPLFNVLAGAPDVVDQNTTDPKWWDNCQLNGVALAWNPKVGLPNLVVYQPDLGIPENVLEVCRAEHGYRYCTLIENLTGDQKPCRYTGIRKSEAAFVATITRRGPTAHINIRFEGPPGIALDHYWDLRLGDFSRFHQQEPLDVYRPEAENS
jgi:hypothetical protein